MSDVATILKPSDLTGTPLTEWALSHEPDEALYWKSGMWAQVRLLRDIHWLFWPEFESNKAHQPLVVSTHRSKSVVLPVTQIENESVRIRTRGNFHNQMVSVEAISPVEDVFDNLFSKRDDEINPIYCEGFDPSWVFPSYSTSPNRFTVQLPYHEHAVWAFCWLLTRQFTKEKAHG